MPVCRGSHQADEFADEGAHLLCVVRLPRHAQRWQRCQRDQRYRQKHDAGCNADLECRAGYYEELRKQAQASADSGADLDDALHLPALLFRRVQFGSGCFEARKKHRKSPAIHRAAEQKPPTQKGRVQFRGDIHRCGGDGHNEGVEQEPGRSSSPCLPRKPLDEEVALHEIAHYWVAARAPHGQHDAEETHEVHIGAHLQDVHVLGEECDTPGSHWRDEAQRELHFLHPPMARNDHNVVSMGPFVVARADADSFGAILDGASHRYLPGAASH
mmetsp:Transcript_87936/g.253895  ORF Transcript_87936/g.253895 Transcript_87936/m.253895 type:complete len:272 (+) Transcript_87936:643-1458(+)